MSATIPLSIRMPRDLYDRIIARGGAAWARETLAGAVDRDDVRVRELVAQIRGIAQGAALPDLEDAAGELADELGR